MLNDGVVRIPAWLFALEDTLVEASHLFERRAGMLLGEVPLCEREARVLAAASQEHVCPYDRSDALVRRRGVGHTLHDLIAHPLGHGGVASGPVEDRAQQ